jgi:hypothetical protein
VGKPRLVVWFSCGDASAVAAKIALARYGNSHEVAIARCIVSNEHEDNSRFAVDCAAWFGQPIVELRSTKYADVWDVWERERFLSGVGGARCTVEMKKAVRWEFEKAWQPDVQAFGFHVGEEDRAATFRAGNPEIELLTPLIDAGLKKEDCHAIIRRAGILRSAMYDLGFPNANCKMCVKDQSPRGWMRRRHYFPTEFARLAILSRKLGCRLVKLTSGTRERIFLDELPADYVDAEPEPNIECSLLCIIAEQDMKVPT